MTKGSESKPGDSTAIRNYPRLSLRYARLLELTTDLVSTLDLESLLNRIVEAAQELTESEAASLLLHDPETNHLYFEAATSSLVEGLGRPAIPTENSIAGWIFSHGEPLIVDDVLRDPRFFREVDVLTRFQTRSVLGVPLRTKKRTLGVIEAVNKGHGGFNEEDRRLLQTLAAQAAIAIENSRLFSKATSSPKWCMSCEHRWRRSRPPLTCCSARTCPKTNGTSSARRSMPKYGG